MRKYLRRYILIISILFLPLIACSSKTSVPSAQPTVVKTLKIGYTASLSASTSLDMIKAIELQIELDNESGGLVIGPDRYQVQLVKYDNNNSQSGEVAAI